MSVILAGCFNNIRFILANATRPFHPAPAHDDLPEAAELGEFCLAGRPGAYQAFQLIVASDANARVESVSCDGLGAKDEFTCLATEGTDSAGCKFAQSMYVEGGKPWSLWCLVRLNCAGIKTLTLVVRIDGSDYRVSLIAKAEGDYDEDAGVTERDSLARLSWLNSRQGISDSIPAPFTAIRRDNRTLRILGRDIELGMDGCPAQIFTHYVGNNANITAEGRPILANPIAFVVKHEGRKLSLMPRRLTFGSVLPHRVEWSAESTFQGVSLRLEGSLEFDGTLMLGAYIKADKPAEYEVELRHTPMRDYSGLFIGLGVRGGRTPTAHTWKWDAEKRQDAYWVGGVNGGLLIKPRDPDMQQPFINLYYHHGPRNLPVNWVNDGKGGFELANGILRYFSGAILLEPTEKRFCAELMISPFKTVEQRGHFVTRYYHGGPYKEDRWASHAHENGCTCINYHHGNDGYPFINYPMYDDRTFHKLITEAHSYDIGVKPYYTVRELTSRLPELWALRALRDEILPAPTYQFDGISFQGGVDSFIKDNFHGQVIPAWKHVFESGPYAGQCDPALITNPMSRIANFYIEGLHYMCRRWGIDGIYIDDAGFDRTIMRRIRRVLDKERPGALIDLHSWNHFENNMGAGWGHTALIYAQLMPYVDSLWWGEDFDYENTSAEHILVEISGLPFGLMGEMLQGGGNVWRGLLYGMTNRFPYQEKSPVAIWKLYDKFGFNNVNMVGFWDADATVTTDSPDVKCTVYESVEHGHLLICCASFADSQVTFMLRGLPEGYRVFFPQIDDIQAQGWYDGCGITLEVGGGCVLWAERIEPRPLCKDMEDEQ